MQNDGLILRCMSASHSLSLFFYPSPFFVAFTKTFHQVHLFLFQSNPSSACRAFICPKIRDTVLQHFLTIRENQDVKACFCETMINDTRPYNYYIWPCNDIEKTKKKQKICKTHQTQLFSVTSICWIKK